MVTQAARLRKYSLYFLLGNLLLVMAVAILRPATAGQQTSEAEPPDVEMPQEPQEQANDGPALPSPSPTGTSALPASPAAPTPASAAADKMVYEEILKVIQNPNSDLNVPPLTYPTLPLANAASAVKPATSSDSGAASMPADLQLVEMRLKSIHTLTQSAQLLIKEASIQRAAGNVTMADALSNHAKSVRAMIAQLADDAAVGSPQTMTVR